LSTLPDWARALGDPLCTCRIRSTPGDFVVTELLDIDFSGDGEHDWLWVEKTGANTTWVAEQLAKHAGVHPRDVGYSGLKDRHAVTYQWFSIRRPSGEGTDWSPFEAEGVNVLEQHRHQRKLKRGAHKGNVFRIALRGKDLDAHEYAIDERLKLIGEQGVPNYFGEQRFGRDGSNIELGEAVLTGRRLSRNKRSIGISALRSVEFNNELSERIDEGTWNLMLPGDKANLNGSGSVFDVEEVTDDLVRRCIELDIHPCGTLPALEKIGVKAAFRPLRVRVGDPGWKKGEDAFWLEFQLPKGSFATSVLREIVYY
jgi:tRNA pseudouridine13 synthase